MKKLTKLEASKIESAVFLAQDKIGCSGNFDRAREVLAAEFDLTASSEELAEEIIGMVHYGMWPPEEGAA